MPHSPLFARKCSGTANATQCIAARITAADGTGFTTGSVTIAPPSAGIVPSNYTLVLTPVGGGASVTVTCTTPASCPVTGLQNSRTYTVSGTSNMPDGSTIPLNTDSLTTLDPPICWVRGGETDCDRVATHQP